MRVRTILSTMFAALLLITGFQGASAQVPETAEVQAQAAAMTLTSEDLPTGFQLTGETFLPVPELEGATARYVSVYTNIDTGQVIRSYVTLFETEDQAVAGYEVLEEEAGDNLTDGEVSVSSGNAEITTGTYEGANGEVIGTADVTFVSGTAVAGVAVDNPDGTEPDAQLATDLATLMNTRVGEVQVGSSTIDLSLTGQIVPFANGGTLVQSGFLSSGESEAIYGTQGSALTGLGSSYVQTVAYGEEGSAPRVTIGVTTFGSAEEATEVVEQAGNIFQPLADQETVEDASVDGADSTAAYRYTSRDGSIADQESYRIIFSQGDKVTVVDVQGAADSETAEAAANAIASSQMACQGEGTCEVPVAPGVIPGAE